MPRREQSIAILVAAVVLNVLAGLQAVGDPPKEDGRGEGEGH